MPNGFLGTMPPIQNPNVLRALGSPPQMPSMGQPGFYAPGNPLYSYHNPGTTTDNIFNKAITASTPSTGVSSGYQSILDTIKKQQDYATGVGMSAAQSLAAKRGLTGSSMEQFGTQQAVEAASRAAQDSSSNVLLQNEQAQNQLRQLQAQLYGSRAQSLAGLNSDELTSLRNADYSNNYLNLQQTLGQQGLDISRDNIQANRDMANQQARNSLLTSGASILAPYLLGGGAGAGTGLSGLFGGGGAGVASAAGGFTPYAAGGLPGPYAYGTAGAGAGTGLYGLAAAHPIAAGAAAGYGAMITDHAIKGTFNNTLGQSAGAAGRFLFNPIGSQLNFAKDALSNPGNAVKNATNKATNAVSSVFPF